VLNPNCISTGKKKLSRNFILQENNPKVFDRERSGVQVTDIAEQFPYRTLSSFPFKKVLQVLKGSCHKRQRRKRQSVTAKREKSQTPKFLTATLTLPNLT